MPIPVIKPGWLQTGILANLLVHVIIFVVSNAYPIFLLAHGIILRNDDER
jgi:hypothetical protein